MLHRSNLLDAGNSAKKDCGKGGKVLRGMVLAYGRLLRRSRSITVLLSLLFRLCLAMTSPTIGGSGLAGAPIGGSGLAGFLRSSS